MRYIKILLLLLSLLLATTITAERYKILYLNFPKVLINGKQAKVGDIFNDKAIIKWSKERQAMKVKDVATGRRYLMTSKQTDKQNLTAYEILMRNKHLSTYDDGTESGSPFDRLEKGIEAEYDLLDSIIIALPSGINIDDKHYFQVSYDYGDTRLTKRLLVKKNHIIIDKTLFIVDGEKLVPRDIDISIDYVNDNSGELIFIKDNIRLTIFPEK